jgi:hypothetical protein
MCRNITVLRGLQPAATADEVEAAARQYVRKVGGLTTPAQMASADVAEAIEAVAVATRRLLAVLPARRHPPATLPPMRR